MITCSSLTPLSVLFFKALFLPLGPSISLYHIYNTQFSILILSLSLNHHMYADDTQLFFSFCTSDFDVNISLPQNVLQQISSWMTANLSSTCDFMVGLGKPQLRAKF